MPMLLLLLAGWAALAMAGCLVLASDEEPPRREELVAVSGQVFDTFLRRARKGHSQVHVLVQGRDGTHDLAQDASPFTLGLLNLPKGAAVSALVLPGSIAEPADRLWELRRGDLSLLSYESLVDVQSRRSRRASVAGQAFGVLAALALGAALIFRRRFGSWRGQPREAVRP